MTKTLFLFIIDPQPKYFKEIVQIDIDDMEAEKGLKKITIEEMQGTTSLNIDIQNNR